MTLALRQRLGRRSSRSLSRMLVAGTNDSLAGLSLKAANAYLWESGPSFLGGAILCTIGFLLLLLFCYAKDSRQMELLWFSMVSLSIGSIRIVEFVRGVPNNIPDLYFTLLVVMANVANGFAYPRIFFALAGKRLPRFYYWVSMGVIGLFALFGISALLSFTQRLSGLVPSLNVFLLLLASAAVAAFWPPWQIPRPLRLASILCLLLMFGNSARQLILLLFPSSSSWVTAATNIQSVFMLVSLCGLFVVIAQRHRQVALDRAELQSEMKSAQEVQRLLTASTPDVAPWARLEVAYVPAKEVGGDFYFSRQTSEGQLIVVGDVSGKGLRAAMLASVALGAIRNSSTWSPGPLLQSLNSALHGQTGGGFVTCCAALVRSDGRLSVANAGHPSPYVDGQEFPVEAGLPLGIMPDVAYQESTGHGEIITLVSDGVVEAENAQRELFGFDRTREISGKSAQEIAEAAQAWGQNDDITVVTVRRQA